MTNKPSIFIKSTRFVLALVFVLASQAFSTTALHSQPILIPASPTLGAKAWLLIDAKTGHVIVEHNADEMLPPASLTKMMTSYIAAEQLAAGNITLNETVLVSEKAWRKGGSKMYIQEGRRVTVEDLLRGVIIQSGNDASIALAEHIAGSEDAFADLMNKTAHTLNMADTHFVNSTGWPAENHYTTARDLSKLARALIYGHPEHYSYYSEKEFTYNNIRQPNRNKLLWRDSSVDGIKTGHTMEAGYNLVSSAERNEMRLISVILGANSENNRAGESLKLLTYGFLFYETFHLYQANQVLVEPKIWMGEKDKIKLGITNDLWITIPRHQQEKVQYTLDFPAQIYAPMESGDAPGSVEISLNGEPIADSPLTALETIPKAGLFTRIWHYILLFFNNLFQ